MDYVDYVDHSACNFKRHRMKELEQMDLNQKIAVAETTDSEYDLKCLTCSFEWCVRIRVACRRDAPADALEELANDSNYWVRDAVANNESTPLEVKAALMILQGEPTKEDVLLAANCSFVPEYVLRKIYEDFSFREQTDVLKALAGNPCTPLDILEELAKISSYELKEEVLRNLNCPLDLMKKLKNEIILYNF